MQALFEKIVLADFDQVHRLASRIAWDTRRPGKWILEIRCCFTHPPKDHIDWLSDCHMILLHAPQLRRYSLPSRVATLASDLASILAATEGTAPLSRLQIALDKRSTDALFILPRFLHLNYMALEINANWPPYPEYVPVLELPGLRSVRLAWHHGEFGQIGRWLTLAQFANVQKIDLYLPPLSIEDGLALSKLLVNHAVTCRELIVSCPRDHNLSNFAQFLTFGTERLVFPDSVPPPSVLSQADTGRLKTLDVFTNIDGQRLWTLIEALREHDHHHQRLCLRVRLESSKFTWDSGGASEQHAHFVGRIVHHAFSLAKVGVDVLDEDGFTVTKHFIQGQLDDT
jgi:hypothetical protein